MYGVCISPIYIKASSWPNLLKSFPGGNSVGGRERKDIHLSLSPELLYKAGKLPPDLRQMFKSSPIKKVLLFWPGCLLQTQEHLVNPSISGLGELCVCYIISDPLLKFLPSLSHSYMQTQTDMIWLGHALASPRCVRSSAYLESVCLLPLTDSETVGFSAASLSVSFKDWGGEEGQREEGLGDDEVGKRKAG